MLGDGDGHALHQLIRIAAEAGFAAVTIAFVGVEVFNADLAAGPPQQAAREAYTHMAELLAAIAGEAS